MGRPKSIINKINKNINLTHGHIQCIRKLKNIITIITNYYRGNSPHFSLIRLVRSIDLIRLFIVGNVPEDLTKSFNLDQITMYKSYVYHIHVFHIYMESGEMPRVFHRVGRRGEGGVVKDST